MNILHITNGDALENLLQKTSIKGPRIVCRECLMDGPSTPTINDAFWELREKFISENYPEQEGNYYKLVVSEITSLNRVDKGTEINLWFENDLFCQSNYWFIITYLHDLGLDDNLYRVFPFRDQSMSKWKTFGKASEKELMSALSNREKFTNADVDLGIKLWKAYASKDSISLVELSRQSSQVFSCLQEIIQANIDRFPEQDNPGRPEKTLQAIYNSGLISFSDVFKEFSRREEIYGYGDTQVKNLIKQLK
ncbi:MAG: hypothetical protein ABIR06_04640 [Cyclobacteriaceae bacterium]